MRPSVRLILLLALAASAVPAGAEVTPSASEGDPHIQTVAYDPQEVVGLHVATGFAVTLVFSPEERIETVTVGDSAGWLVQANRRADNLVVKPLGSPGPTNLTVMSDLRSYNFTLYAESAGYGVQPYLVRFTYPAPPPPAEAAVERPAQPAAYRVMGSRTLRPVAMSDDGEFTTIHWAKDKPLPAVYQEDVRGQMALVNGTMRDGAYVIEGVHQRLVFIRGSAKTIATRVTDRARP